MKSVLVHSVLLFVMLCSEGCFESTADNPRSPESHLTEIEGSELVPFIQSSNRHVLVEFGVDHNCGRCASMKPTIVGLAEKYHDKADVIRIDYASNMELVSKFGGTVCPTYVLFEKGQVEPVFTQSFPASEDVLEAELLALLALNDE